LNLALAEDNLPNLSSSQTEVYDYELYGLRIRSHIKLTLDDVPVENSADVELLPGTPERFASVVSQITLDHSDWIHIHQLSDGWTYLRYEELFEFLVAPLGNFILYRFLTEVHLESFQTYILGRVFSFALVKMGYEPLHAATIVVNGKAVAFLGASTFGKSSLAACFIAAGYPLLTDDTLRLEERDGQYVAFPGPPRLRLMPRIGRLYLGSAANGVVMNPREKDAKAPKLVFCLSPSQSYTKVVQLGAIYVVTAPRKVHRKQRIAIGSLSPLQALMNVISFTHNDELANSDRLSRQLEAAQRLIAAVSIRSLAYPRILASLDEVKDAVVEDLKNYDTRI
jgi:hypothetical protein